MNEPDVSPSLCFPGKTEVAEALAEITGKKMSAVEGMIASVRCSRPEGNVKKKYSYIGYLSCTGASLAFGGPEECRYACVGFGECAEICPFHAIAMVDGFPVVDPGACVGCGACVKICPKEIIKLISRNIRVFVPCSSQYPGKKTREICEVGCIACRICIKVCPAKAVNLIDNEVVIYHNKCIEYGPECGEVCVEKCPREIFRHFRPARNADEQVQAAAG